jgi:hypothetical protein
MTPLSNISAPKWNNIERIMKSELENREAILLLAEYQLRLNDWKKKVAEWEKEAEGKLQSAEQLKK